MRNISLLDCTLRDGGYVNDWNFGHNTITSVVERLAQAGLDFIEVGFLDQRQPENLDRTIQPTTQAFDQMLSGVDSGNAKLLAMVDYGTCSLENIAPCQDTILDGIRVIFKKPRMREAVAFGQELIRRGYIVFLQMVSITSYSDRDILDFTEIVNEVSPYAVSMVDTYGLMHKEEMLNYFFLLDHNLKPGISIGYHSHNNFQLAYANTIEMLKRSSRHDLLVDGSAYGMGKSAGNAPLELLAMHMNENYGKSYDIDQILEIIDTNIMRIYQQLYWGYNLLFYISASNDCHPSYVDYLLKKRTLSIKTVNDILKQIPREKKLNYDQPFIEDLYTRIQNRLRCDARSLQSLSDTLAGHSILLLGPGQSIHSHKKSLDGYIKENSPVVIAVNFLPKGYTADYVFISNAKRYLAARKDLNERNTAVIATSNVTPIGKDFAYSLSYGDLLSNQEPVADNALLMLLQGLLQMGIHQVALAGFDGFSIDSTKNYYDASLDMAGDPKRLAVVNRMIAESLRKYAGKLEMDFLTPSIYAED